METGNSQSAPAQPMASSQDTGPEAPGYGLSADNAMKERRLRKALIFLGVLILAYIYTDGLFAQQSAARRVSIGQAADFPNDI